MNEAKCEGGLATPAPAIAMPTCRNNAYLATAAASANHHRTAKRRWPRRSLPIESCDLAPSCRRRPKSTKSLTTTASTDFVVMERRGSARPRPVRGRSQCCHSRAYFGNGEMVQLESYLIILACLQQISDKFKCHSADQPTRIILWSLSRMHARNHKSGADGIICEATYQGDQTPENETPLPPPFKSSPKKGT